MKIILFKNTVESQEFFSFELSKAFREMGHEIFFYDCADEMYSYTKLLDFVEIGNTAAFAFNFNGMMNDHCLCRGREPVFWNETRIPYINMIVDHPYYYHEEFAHIPARYTQLCIDKNHMRYMRRFFPEIDASHFVELGGTKLDTGLYFPIKDRLHNLIFTGNYTAPESYEKYIAGCEKPVIDFYHKIYHYLIEHPQNTLEDAAERMMKEAFGDEATDYYLLQSFANMIFIDLQVRHYFRGRAVAALANAGIKIKIFGSGYEALHCRHENIECTGQVNSERCLAELSRAKVSLNVMPWFKDGSHDRVFNSMLNGAVCISDHSKTLDEHFQDGEDIAFYSLDNIDDLPKIYDSLISRP